MNDLETYALAAGAIIAVPVTIAIILAALAQQAAQQCLLMVTVSGPGTLNITEGTHSYPGPTQVTVTATPAAGYQTNWNLNGIDVERGVDIYSVYVNGLVTLGVYFTPTAPPHGPIAGIRSVGTVGTLQNFNYYFDKGGGAIHVDECDEAWNRGLQCEPELMQFKVYDSGGVGIPNVTVAIYPESNPDQTVLKAFALFDGALTGPFFARYIDASNPLLVNTDMQGLASFRIRNLYGAEGLYLDPSQAPDGFGKQLSQSTGVYATRTVPIIISPQEKVFPIWKYQGAGIGYIWWSGDGGSTAQYNRNIRAEIVGTAYWNIEPVTVNFTTKWG